MLWWDPRSLSHSLPGRLTTVRQEAQSSLSAYKWKWYKRKPSLPSIWTLPGPALNSELGLYMVLPPEIQDPRAWKMCQHLWISVQKEGVSCSENHQVDHVWYIKNPTFL